jgi:hypothetical protein
VTRRALSDLNRRVGKPEHPLPRFFVSVASKGLRNSVSGLESTLTGILTSVDSKEVARGEKHNLWCREIRRSTTLPELPSLKPIELLLGIAQVYLGDSINEAYQMSRKKMQVVAGSGPVRLEKGGHSGLRGRRSSTAYQPDRKHQQRRRKPNPKELALKNFKTAMGEESPRCNG